MLLTYQQFVAYWFVLSQVKLTVTQLPHNFQEVYIKHFQRPLSNDVYTHCKQELMQAIWRLLLDEKFVDAYKSGLVIKFADNVDCHGFLQFYTYGSDYPEKYVPSLSDSCSNPMVSVTE